MNGLAAGLRMTAGAGLFEGACPCAGGVGTPVELLMSSMASKRASGSG